MPAAGRDGGVDVPSVAPQIVAQPSSQHIAPGSTATFDVLTSGDGQELRYQWLRNGMTIPGAQGQSYRLTNVQCSDSAAVFSVDVSNASGRARSQGAGLVVAPCRVALLAGSAEFLSSGSSDGVGSSARFFSPVGLAFGRDGSLLVADSGNGVIRKVTPDGQVTTPFGTARASGWIDGSGSAVRFNFPTHIATDAQGNTYVSDQGNEVIRKIAANGTVSTLAGAPWGSYLESLSGSRDGIGDMARFSGPSGLALDAAGSLYVFEAGVSNPNIEVSPPALFGGGRIRKITALGQVTTLFNAFDLIAAAQGAPVGSGASHENSGSTGIAMDAGGNLFVTARRYHAVFRIALSGAVTVLAGSPDDAGSDDGNGSSARFRSPEGLALDTAGNLIVADTGNHTIRKIAANGSVTTVAGSPGRAGSNNGKGSVARFNSPKGVVADSAGAVYVADSGNDSIRKISADGNVSLVAGLYVPVGDGIGATAGVNPRGLATDAQGNVYVADNVSVRKITPDGVVTTLAGDDEALPAVVDGVGTSARFNFSRFLTVDASGTVYVTDHLSVRKVTQGGQVQTLVAPSPGFHPEGIAVDGGGNVYVAESERHVIRKITPSGAVSVFAGATEEYGFKDGPGGEARFAAPVGLAIDHAGNLYVADKGNHAVRKVTPTGMVTTLAGVSGQPSFGDGVGPNAGFQYPRGIAVDAGGIVYVMDSGNEKVRRVTPLGEVSTLTGAGGAALQVGTPPYGLGIGDGIAVDRNGLLYVGHFAGVFRVQP